MNKRIRKKKLKQYFMNLNEFSGMQWMHSIHTGKLIKMPWMYGTPKELLKLGYPKNEIEPDCPHGMEVMNKAKKLGIW